MDLGGFLARGFVPLYLCSIRHSWIRGYLIYPITDILNLQPITDKFKKRKQEHAAKNTEGENSKKARKVVIASKPVATPVVIENTNKKGKHRGDKRDKTDDLIDKHINAMSSGLSNWL